MSFGGKKGVPKNGVLPTPLQVEAKSDRMKAPASFMKARTLFHLKEQVSNPNSTQEVKDAAQTIVTRMETASFQDAIGDAYFEDFVLWLKGQSEWNVPWVPANLHCSLTQ